MTWQPSERYPDPSIVALDPSFKKYHLALSAVEKLWTGSRWGEGPVWLGDARCLLWSDIPNNRVLKWDETTGTVSEWRKPSNNANGHTRDRQGRIIACEHAGRRVVRFEYDGSITVIAEQLPGQEAEQPERRGGEVRRQHLVHRPALRHLRLLRGQQAAGRAAAHPCLPRRWPDLEITLVADDIDHPNGLAFSPDESLLYVIESRSEPRNILAYDVVGGTKLAKRRVFYACKPGETPDGFRVDIDGNLWCGWGMTPEYDGVRVLNAAGAPIGHIHLPERCANLCFGGRDRNRLFMSAAQSLFSLYVNTQGVAGG